MNGNKLALRMYHYDPAMEEPPKIIPWAGNELYQIIFYDAINPDITRGYAKTVMSNGCCTRPCTLAEQAVDDLGNHQWWEKIMTPEFMAAVESGLTALQAVDELFDRKQIKAWEKRAAFAISTLFSDMYFKKLSIGLGWATNPFLPLAARGLGWKGVMSLQAGEYIDFIYLNGSGKTNVMLP